MNTVTLSGNDTIIFDDDILSDLADGKCASATFDSDKGTVKTGKNGNAVMVLNESGRQCTMEIRLVKGSGDDKKLHARMKQQDNNFAGFIVANVQFIKNLGDGAGNVGKDTYIFSS